MTTTAIQHEHGKQIDHLRGHYRELRDACNGAWKMYLEAVDTEPRNTIEDLYMEAERLERQVTRAWLDWEKAKADYLEELREPPAPEAERQEAESERVSEWLEVGEAVQVAYGEAVAIAAEVRARQEEGRKELLDLWELEARDAEAGTRFSVSGGEVEER